MTPLDTLTFMQGSWRIQGHMHGQAVQGAATVERVAAGLLYREVVDGYEDLCIYRVDPHGELEVHHFSEDGVFRHAVHRMDDSSGFHWVPMSVHGPVVRVLPQADGFRIEVAHRDAPTPDVVLEFRRT